VEQPHLGLPAAPPPQRPAAASAAQQLVSYINN
jgi:hypothetical protein